MRGEILPINQVVVGDVLDVLRTLPDECVDCVVTSPPYWGLRDYGTASWEDGDPECDHAQTSPRFNGPKQTAAQVSGHASKAESHNRTVCPKCGARRIDRQIGLEATPEAFVAKMVEVFREVRRVLADHGTCWVNLGDSYCSAQGGRQAAIGELPKDGNARFPKKKSRERSDVDVCGWSDRDVGNRVVPSASSGLKPKDLVGIPWRVAFALQADGWWLRQDIIWFKPNPMPESVTDRCTKAHEYVFLLTKQPRYWYDAEAVKEPNSPTTGKWGKSVPSKTAQAQGNGRHGDSSFLSKEIGHAETLERYYTQGRNRRSVWSIPTQPMPEAHFATYPEKLVEPCVLAGCPREVCRVCGKPRERVVERKHYGSKSGNGDPMVEGFQRNKMGVQQLYNNEYEPPTTIGWTDCGCGDYRPGIVLDPFGGSGTTGIVAAKCKRDYILIELNEEYAETIARPRLSHVETGVTVAEQRAGQLPLFEGK